MSDDVNFAEYIQSERDSLTIRRRQLLNERGEIDRVLAGIETEFAAVSAYEAAKTGKTLQPTRSGAAQRARRGSRREAILSELSAAPNGMTRGELLDAFGVKGNKSGEGSVSNALAALQKAGQVARQGGGRWAVVATAQLRQAAE